MKYYIKTALIIGIAISINRIAFSLDIYYPELRLVSFLLSFGVNFILIVPLNKYFRLKEIIKKYNKESQNIL